MQQIQNFGDPFLFVIHGGETLADVKLRIQKKLQVPDAEFSNVCMSVLFNYLHYILGILKLGQLFYETLTHINNYVQCSICFSACFNYFSGCRLNKVLFHNWYIFSPCCLSFQWKFAFVLHGRPEYLQDSDIVCARFQVCQYSFSCLIFHFGCECTSLRMSMESV